MSDLAIYVSHDVYEKLSSSNQLISKTEHDYLLSSGVPIVLNEYLPDGSIYAPDVDELVKLQEDMFRKMMISLAELEEFKK